MLIEQLVADNGADNDQWHKKAQTLQEFNQKRSFNADEVRARWNSMVCNDCERGNMDS